MRNANAQHRESLTLLDRIAVFITSRVGTMYAAIAFTLLAIVSLPAALHSHDPIIIVAWVAQTFLQLVLLPIIMVGQNLSSRHSEIRADLEYQASLQAEKNTELILTALKKINNRLIGSNNVRYEIMYLKSLKSKTILIKKVIADLEASMMKAPQFEDLRDDR